MDLAGAMDQRDRPGPRPLVDRGVEPELGEIERRRLQRERNIDRAMAVVDGKSDVDAGAMRAPKPATPPQVVRRSPTKSPIAPVLAEIP
jgi:hypothetical protein